MVNAEYLLEGTWLVLLDTMKAVEETSAKAAQRMEVARVALTLLGLLMDAVQGTNERVPNIRKLISDLEVIGRAE